MSSSNQQGMKEHPARQGRIRVLATLGVLALTMLLLVWGLLAVQWTLLTTANDVGDALATASVLSEYGTYSIPLGMQRDYPVCINFQIASSSPCTASAAVSIPTKTLPAPGSNITTTIEDYVVFSVTNPNGTALTVWYTGPQGNLTQICSSPPERVTCTYSPSAPGSRIGPYTKFFKTNTSGNYSIQLLSTSCQYTPNSCSTTTAVGSFSLATGVLTYSRPYWAFGLATVVVSGASITATIAYVAIISYRNSKQHSR